MRPILLAFLVVSDLDAIAASVGLDVATVKRDSEACVQWIADSLQSLQPIGVHGTPAFFVNGRPVVERSIAALDKLIDEELAKADNKPEYYERAVLAKGLKQVKGRFED